MLIRNGKNNHTQIAIPQKEELSQKAISSSLESDDKITDLKNLLEKVKPKIADLHISSERVLIKQDTEKPIHVKRKYHIPLLERLSSVMYHKNFDSQKSFIQHHEERNEQHERENTFSV